MNNKVEKPAGTYCVVGAETPRITLSRSEFVEDAQVVAEKSGTMLQTDVRRLVVR